MKSIFLFTILLCTLGNNLICFGSNTSPISINIRVIDSQKQRLPGVYLLQNSTKYLLETTNEDGECIINIENFNSKRSTMLRFLHNFFICRFYTFLYNYPIDRSRAFNDNIIRI